MKKSSPLQFIAVISQWSYRIDALSLTRNNNVIEIIIL
jgi:hypothetical protein